MKMNMLQVAFSSVFLLSSCGTSSKAKEGTFIPTPDDIGTAPEDATESSSGVKMKVLTAGKEDAETPQIEDLVVVHYSGWTASDGQLFDSSVKRGTPAKFPVSKLIPGFTETLLNMKTGDKVRAWIPADMAYGEESSGGAPAGALVFDIELLEIDKSLRVPDDLDGPPEDAQTTESGLVYKVMRIGTGTERPKEDSRVRVHYTGWQQSDGVLFDSSVQRSSPTEFGLGQVIPGWREGVQLMREGEKTRFWIPAHLAYGETASRPGAPSGILVFDIELLKILN